MRMALAAVAAGWMAGAAWGGDVAVTVYNGGFACVREARELELQEGENAMRLTDMSGQMEADSVVLRETGGEPFGVEILEQRYVNEPLSQALMLREMEGREVRFRVAGKDGVVHEETGTLLRSGWTPEAAARVYGTRYVNATWAGLTQPIVQMADGVRFTLPGEPVFDGVDAGAYLKPSLEWVLWSGRAGLAPVEVSYLTGGMSWEATYNLVASEEGGDEYALSGWVGIRNDSGKDYPEADIKLIAGDVGKVVARAEPMASDDFIALGAARRQKMPEERSFDEFHLYTMPRKATLKSGELKQIEFLRAGGVHGEREYVYEPLRGWRGPQGCRDRNVGVNNEKKVAVQMVVSNSETNGLGVPLPKGTMRLYRRDAKDGRPEFVGESSIDHTPKDEPIRLDNGYAFDLAAERTQTDFNINIGTGRAVERFEIKVRNHKKTAVKVRLVEHLWRCATWEINEESAPHEKTASDRAEWVVEVPADGEAVVTYSVLYSWM